MKKHHREVVVYSSIPKSYEFLETLTRGKMQEFIQDVLNEELETFLGRRRYERRSNRVDCPSGSRNGYGKPRSLAMMGGTITVRRPRARGTEERFVSKLLPLFRRRTKEVGDLLPELYLHGLAKGDFELALRGLLGGAAPLSRSSIDRLRAKWQLEYDAWKKRDLSALNVVYQWADGIYVKAGLDKEKAALLVIIGVLESGEKVFLALESGYRESKESWAEVLRDLKARGLRLPRLTVADGHLGIWAALDEVHPEGDQQRCWNHRIRNVLDALPKKLRPEAKEEITKIPYAETKGECTRLRDAFVRKYRLAGQRKAADKLLVDWERMTAFYAYPREHWRHLRTTNIVESPFDAIRLRTNAGKRYRLVESARALIWKLMQVAEKSFRKANGPELLPAVYAGRKFFDGLSTVSKLNNEVNPAA
jgi:transposase-like protein